MSHKAVRTLISDTIKAIDDDVVFAYARSSDFDQIGEHQDKRVRLDPISASVEFTDDSFNMTKTYDIGMVFYKLDSEGGTDEDSSLILDEMDLMSDRFINKLNLFNFEDETDSDIQTGWIQLKGINKEPVIKVTSNWCTGFIVKFKIIVPDSFDYCSIYE